MIPYEIGVSTGCEIGGHSSSLHRTSHPISSCPVYCCSSGSHSQENTQHYHSEDQEVKTGEQLKPEDRKIEDISKDSGVLMTKPAFESNSEPEKVTEIPRSSPSLVVTPSTSGLRGNMLSDHSLEDSVSISSQGSVISSTPLASALPKEKSSEENFQAEKQKNESSGDQSNDTLLSGERIKSNNNAYQIGSVDQQLDNKVPLNEPQLGTDKYEASQIETREAEIHSRYLSSTDHPREHKHRHKRAAVEDSSKHSVSDVQSVTRNERTRQGRQYKNRPSSTYMSILVASLNVMFTFLG
ncbi:uncharacterized protein LOC141856787 [Brevipalpus obovatus]|uniref:uncharacterized protein LOC141856787 n=1 Tax=Brevipalpus obovatus TaxID=246614 RepID=UPI003D9F984A